MSEIMPKFIYRGILKQIEYSVTADQVLSQELGQFPEYVLNFVNPNELRLILNDDLRIEIVIDKLKLYSQVLPKQIEILNSPVE